jgi:steroid delta-isomerase-like uncharacterized protein
MRFYSSRVACVALLLCALACAPDPAERNREVVLAMVEAINARDFDALDTLVAPDVRRHSAATPDVEVRSLDDFKDFLRQDLSAIPDATMEVEQIFATDDMVAVRAMYSGTQTGPMGPFPPSDRPVTIPFIGLQRMENGMIAEIWVEWDNLSALAQLGHFEPPTEAPQTEGD